MGICEFAQPAGVGDSPAVHACAAIFGRVGCSGDCEQVGIHRCVRRIPDSRAIPGGGSLFRGRCQSNQSRWEAGALYRHHRGLRAGPGAVIHSASALCRRLSRTAIGEAREARPPVWGGSPWTRSFAGSSRPPAPRSLLRQIRLRFACCRVAPAEWRVCRGSGPTGRQKVTVLSSRTDA